MTEWDVSGYGLTLAVGQHNKISVNAHCHKCMYDGWFVLLSRHKLQICSNGGTTNKYGPARCEAVLHGYGTSPLEGDGGLY